MNNREAIALWLYFFAQEKVGADTIWTVYRGIVNGQHVIKRRLRGRNHVEVHIVPPAD